MQKPERLKTVPPAWAELHERSARALLRSETNMQRDMRRRLRSVVNQTVAEIAVSQSVLDERRALLLLRRATAQLSQGLEQDILTGRGRARTEAMGQLTRELELARRSLRGAKIEHAIEDPEESDGAHDEFSAHTAALSLATQWGQMSLVAVRRWADDRVNIAQAVASTAQTVSPRIARTAATENSRAYNDEMDEGIGYLAEQHKGAGWIGGAFSIWSAILDRKVCRVCAAHDGEIAPVGFKFDDGDKPGEIHPNCRCTRSLIVLPWHLTNVIPGHYVGLDEDDDAA